MRRISFVGFAAKELHLTRHAVLSLGLDTSPLYASHTTAADTLRREVPNPQIKLLFIDHAKDRYLADLISLEPYLAKGCVVVADNMLCFDGGASLEPYLEHVRDESRYSYAILHEAPVEYSAAQGACGVLGRPVESSDGEPDGVMVSAFCPRHMRGVT